MEKLNNDDSGAVVVGLTNWVVKREEWNSEPCAALRGEHAKNTVFPRE
jgi:hypothetical protein